MKGELREIDRAIVDQVMKRNSRKGIFDRLGRGEGEKRQTVKE
jgi:hypothetical protein